MRFIDTVLVLLVCSSKTLGQGYNYPAPQASTNDGTTPENMFLATASSPSFGYPKPLKDSSNMPPSYFGSSDGTTPISSESPQYGGNNQRSGGANQPQEGGFAGSSQPKGYSGSNNFPPRSQPSNGVHPSSNTLQNSGIKPSNGYSSTNSLNGYSPGPTQTTGNGYQNSGNDFGTNRQNGDSDSRNAQSEFGRFEGISNNFESNNRQEGGSFGAIAEEEGDYSAIPGQPDIDYPVLSSIPDTSFQCSQQEYPGYYADVETRCQVFHVCTNGKTYDFLCPNGTIFHQEFLVCVWWNLFDCSLAPSFYGVNANLYVSQQQSENTPNSGSSTNTFENQELRGIKDDSPTAPGYGSTSPNNPENGGYYSGEPAQSQESHRPSLSPQVPRFPVKQEGNTQKPNGINEYLPPQNQQRSNNGLSSFGQTTGNLPLNNQNQPSFQNENSFNPSITKNGYQDTSTSSTRANNQKPTNSYNQNSSSSDNNNVRRNYVNQQHEGVNEEQPYYQSNQIDRHNEFQTNPKEQSRGATNGNYPQTSYQGSKQNRGYLPPVE